MRGAGNLIVAVQIGRRIAVRPSCRDARQVVGLAHHSHHRHPGVTHDLARVAGRKWRGALVDGGGAARHGNQVGVEHRPPVLGHHERMDRVDVGVEEAAGLRVAPGVEPLHRMRHGGVGAVEQRVRGGATAQPGADLRVNVPHQPVLGKACAVGRQRGAVARVLQRQRVRHGERPVARRVERLQRRNRHRLGGDANPGVAVADDLLARDGPTEVQVEQVRRVEHLDDHRAAEARLVGRTPDEHAGHVRHVRRADDRRSRSGPVVDIRGAGHHELLFDVAQGLQVGRYARVVSGAERVGVGGDGQCPHPRYFRGGERGASRKQRQADPCSG